MMFSEFAAGWVATLVANALVACCLALAGWVVWRWRQNAPIAHALMLLALLKLVTPPLFDCGLGLDFGLTPSAESPVGGGLTWVPGSDTASSGPLVVGGSAVAPIRPEGTEDAIAPRASWLASWSWKGSVGGWIFLIWALGAAATGCLIWRRTRHCRALLERADPAPPQVRATVESLGRALGLRRLPNVRVVHAPVMPFVCSLRGTMTVILPLDLIERVPAEDLRAVLAHELAHVANRDHWVRRLELIACVVHWWNPMSWRIRSALSAMGEHRCDARAVEVLNSGARRYGRALLRVTSSLAPTNPPLPILASGLGGESVLKQRLTMIAEDKLSHRLSFSARCALLLGASALLPLGLVGQGPEKKGGETLDKAAVRKAVLEALRERGIEIGGIEKKLDAALDRAGASKKKRMKADSFGRWVEKKADSDGGRIVRMKLDGPAGSKKWRMLGGDGDHDVIVLQGDGDERAVLQLKKARTKSGKKGLSFFSKGDSDDSKGTKKGLSFFSKGDADEQKKGLMLLKKAMAKRRVKGGDSEDFVFFSDGDGEAKKNAWLGLRKGKDSKGDDGVQKLFVIERVGDEVVKKSSLKLEKGGEGHFIWKPDGSGKSIRLQIDGAGESKREVFFVKPGTSEQWGSIGDGGNFFVGRNGDGDSAKKRVRVRVERKDDSDGGNTWHAEQRGDDIRELKAKIKALKKKLKALQKAGGKRKKSGKTMV